MTARRHHSSFSAASAIYLPSSASFERAASRRVPVHPARLLEHPDRLTIKGHLRLLFSGKSADAFPSAVRSTLWASPLRLTRTKVRHRYRPLGTHCRPDIRRFEALVLHWSQFLCDATTTGWTICPVADDERGPFQPVLREASQVLVVPQSWTGRTREVGREPG